ncbi:hypothetical protein Pstr01_18880 [Pseudomonas straminea]|nr:hypothetical protein [Pseudomonas straminea]GLX13649.1 hypothetical protein Pstr01_18880 [Pseudomonas straminea]
MSALPMNVGDAALTREQLMLRELFQDHFKLADQFEAAAQQVAAVERSLHGTGEQAGLAELLLDAAGQIRGAASTIQGMNLDGFSQVLDSLSRQIAGLPSRLLKPADEMDFRASLREGIAQVLADSIIDAKLQVESEAVDVAISDVANRIKAAMAQMGESSANYFAERNQLKGQLEAEREKNAALVKRMAYFEQDKDNALRLLSSEFANVSKRSGSARMVDVGVGALIALVVSLSTLYPAAEQYLKTPSHNHQQR